MANKNTITALFEHNLWANRILVEACAKLTDEQLDATAPGVYGSIRETLKHLFGSEERYAMQLRNRSYHHLNREEDPFAGFEELKKACEASGQALIEIADEAKPGDMLSGTQRDGDRFEVPAAVVLTQAINHATDHRCHINTVMTYLGLEPLDLDSWAHADTYGLYKTYPPEAKALSQGTPK